VAARCHGGVLGEGREREPPPNQLGGLGKFEVSCNVRVETPILTTGTEMSNKIFFRYSKHPVIS